MALTTSPSSSPRLTTDTSHDIEQKGRLEGVFFLFWHNISTQQVDNKKHNARVVVSLVSILSLEGILSLSYMERAARWCLWSIEGIGSKRISRVIALCEGQVYRLWYCADLYAQLVRIVRPSDRQQGQLKRILNDAPWVFYERELDKLKRDELLVYLDDELYPSALRQLDDPPYFIYIKGSWTGKVGAALFGVVALVGSRQISLQDGRFARSLAHQLASRAVVVSGGALGMDAQAHGGALDAQGITWVVLPCGFRHPTPPSHTLLFERVVRNGGCLLSEYPLDVSARRYHFPRRNRLIVALSDGVVILKANQTGGTMLTAQTTIEQQKPLGVVPYHPEDARASGSLSLLSDARVFLVRNAEDVIGRLWSIHPSQAQLFPQQLSPPAHLGKQAEHIWRLCEHPQSVDDLCVLTRMSSAKMMGLLLQMELDGAIEVVAGMRYLRR